LTEVWSHPFERATPARSFPSFKRQKNFTGLYYAATMDAHVGFESWLERDVAIMLDFDSQVVAFSSQPFWLSWAEDGEQRQHAPDFYLAAAFQFGWIALAEARVITFDPYPFAFLLFISSLLQLVFMFVIMVGQEVLGRAGDQRAQLTFLDAEAVVHECRRLQRHLTAQDKAIGAICSYVEAEAPHDHPLRKAMPASTV